MDLYKLTRQCYTFLDANQLNDSILLFLIFGLSFFSAIILLSTLRKNEFNNQETKITKYTLWTTFILIAYIACPLAFSALIFVICEHVVGIVLAIGLYIGVLKLIYIISETIGYKLSHIKD